MKILVRADANPNIGMGHLMRCLSIADAAAADGHDVSFILADDGMKMFVQQRGYEAIILQSDYRAMEKELDLWPKDASDVVIVDSYFATKRYFDKLKALHGKLVYIDDLAAFPYPVDVLVNYNAYGPDIDYQALYCASGVETPKLILGPEYAPLRSMFRGVEKKKQKKQVRDILISTGGADELHLALKIAQTIGEKRQTDDFVYHLLVGSMNADKDALHALAFENPCLVLHENVVDMKSLICRCDIAVSAAGSTLYEICACGVPLITYVLADNQILGAAAFQRLGLAVNCGDIRTVASPLSILLSAVDRIAADYEYRCKSGGRMQKKVDGFGADRIVAAIKRH